MEADQSEYERYLLIKEIQARKTISVLYTYLDQLNYHFRRSFLSCFIIQREHKTQLHAKMSQLILFLCIYINWHSPVEMEILLQTSTSAWESWSIIPARNFAIDSKILVPIIVLADMTIK